MPRRQRFVPTRIWPLAALALALVSGRARADEPPEAVAFFEAKIRPVLAAHCYQCHSAEALRTGKLKAQLLVDTRAGMQKGGESGAAVVPGKRQESLLLAALKYDGLEMPPTGRLPDQVIADFERWIDMGAPDPRDEPPAEVDARTIDVAAGREHWSYRRLHPASPPPVRDNAWPRTDIDRFVLARLEAAGLSPNPEASRETLARRVFFDLIGLPPTPEELEGFLADTSADAYERLVDRLLESPRFGERWARHWLDTVRYAESGGYEFDGDRGGAHHYRDWVIRAFNADLPYDEFLRMQLAGDLLKPGDYDATSATGFLVAGPYPGQVTAKTVEPIRYDQLDDMLATVGSSMLGMTIGCARCHDHKYDAIAHRDYYAMLACLGKAVQRETDIDRDPEGTRRNLAAWQAEREPVKASVERFLSAELPSRVARWLATEAPARQAAAWLSLDPETLTASKAKLSVEADDVIVASGNPAKDDVYKMTFRTHQRGIRALRLEALATPSAPGGGPGTGPDGGFRLSTLVVTATPLVAAPDRKPVTPRLQALAATSAAPEHELDKALDTSHLTGWSVQDSAGKSQSAVIGFDAALGFEGGTLLSVELRFQDGQHGLARLRLALTTEPGGDALTAVAMPQAARELGAVLEAARVGGRDLSDAVVASEAARWLGRFDADVKNQLATLAAVDAREPKPALVKIYAAANGPWVITGNSQGVSSGGQDVFVLARGEVHRKKEKAVPGFVLAAVASADAEAALLDTGATGQPPDGRVVLSRFLTDVDRGAGPLAARVIANRLWHHHFGRGIVGSPNDLGTQGDPPSHPELLEWLAGRLVDGGFRLKSLHRLIVTSAVYRQAGGVNADARSHDPENLLLWHRRPVRLEGEVIRDALLAVSGRLDTAMGGPSFADVNQLRRSVYMRVKRSEPDAFLRVFDQPEPVQSIGARGVATVPTQALSMLNAPLVRRAAEGLAGRVRKAAGENDAAAVERLFVTALSRMPTPGERERCAAFLAARVGEAAADRARRDAALVDAAHLVLCLNEFIYVD